MLPKQEQAQIWVAAMLTTAARAAAASVHRNLQAKENSRQEVKLMSPNN